MRTEKNTKEKILQRRRNAKIYTVTVALAILTSCFLIAFLSQIELEDVGLTTEITTTVETTATSTSELITEPDLSSLPESLQALYERNEEAREFVLAYNEEYGKEHKININKYLGSDEVPHFIQWDKQWGYLDYAGDLFGLTGCGPTCLSMIAFYLTQDAELTPVYMAEFAEKNGYALEGGGTGWAFFSEGAKQLGFNVVQVPLEKTVIANYLKGGSLIVCNVGEGYFTTNGHYIVFTKYEDDLIYVNDPNSFANTKGWKYEDIKDQIKNMWAISL